MQTAKSENGNSFKISAVQGDQRSLRKLLLVEMGNRSFQACRQAPHSLLREAECHFCYLRDSGLYVHESCCPGNQRHLPTYVGCRRFRYGPLTKYGS
jgi:hypothetical protein